jgi:hypothetical protein
MVRRRRMRYTMLLAMDGRKLKLEKFVKSFSREK